MENIVKSTESIILCCHFHEMSRPILHHVLNRFPVNIVLISGNGFYYYFRLAVNDPISQSLCRDRFI